MGNNCHKGWARRDGRCENGRREVSSKNASVKETEASVFQLSLQQNTGGGCNIKRRPRPNQLVDGTSADGRKNNIALGDGPALAGKVGRVPLDRHTVVSGRDAGHDASGENPRQSVTVETAADGSMVYKIPALVRGGRPINLTIPPPADWKSQS